MHLCCYEAKRPNFELKTWPKQLLGSLLLAFALPSFTQSVPASFEKPPNTRYKF